MAASKSLADTIRSLKPNQTKRVSGYNGNVLRVTACRILGSGNYSAKKVDDNVYDVKRLG